MDISKAEGIISAIEDESRQPSPSHNNLARLSAMFFREIISDLCTGKASVSPGRFVEPTSNVVDMVFTPESQPEKKPGKPKGHKALSKKS